MKALLKNLLRWGKITKAGTDTEQFAVQQMEYLGKVSDGLIVFPYGIHGNVPPESFALMFSVQGNPENRAAIAWTPKDRPQLKSGEVAFYHPPTDALIKWDEGGNLEITTGNGGTGNVVINCENATVNATTKAAVNTAIAEVNATTQMDVTTPLFTVDAAQSVFTGKVDIIGLLTWIGGMAGSGAGGGTVTGNMVITSGDVKADGVGLKTHTHTQGNDSRGDTEVATNVGAG